MRSPSAPGRLRRSALLAIDMVVRRFARELAVAEEVVDGRAPAASCGLATRVHRQAGTAPKELVLACHNGGSGSVHQKFVTRQTAWCSGALTVRPILCLASLEEQC